ncbi:MAG TPA: penicillin-binding transpeptidase domain-containing protein [Polyangiaceae bacterium]|nr:penicillin-binding transpeptidase domain-containing protein [Polyangiaceae bacterium]
MSPALVLTRRRWCLGAALSAICWSRVGASRALETPPSLPEVTTPQVTAPREEAVGLPPAPLAERAAPDNSSWTRVDLGHLRVTGDRVLARTQQGEVAELTLDPELTRVAERLLDQAHPVEGAALLIDVQTGRILVWAERRRGGPPGEVITTARAPAASVFKLVTTAALYEKGDVQPQERVCISGGLRSIERRHLDRPDGGPVSCGTFHDALGFSRNAVFAQLATRRLLRDDLVDIAHRLGFNQELPFDWPVRVGELEVPYNDLEFARTAAGFRGSTLSPLGAAHLASVIAHNGVAQRFHLVRRTPNFEAPPEGEFVGRVFSAVTAARMARMMEVTVHSGTSRQFFTDELGHSYLPGIRVAGKTGTLRPGSREEMTSWFTGFAPSRKPEVVVTVMLENGKIWRQKAAEVARDVLRAYYARKGAKGVTPPG